jgi:uncharacterized protein with HEPN domain
MKDETRACLNDLSVAGRAVHRFAAGLTFAEYQADELVRSAVERKFEIMGEALARIRRCGARVLESIRDWRSVVSFRNILAHGYDVIDDRIVWAIVTDDLAPLLADVDRLLA